MAAAVMGDEVPVSWTSLGVAPWVVRQCESLALKHPTPVQANCVPAALRGEDVIGCAPTGSGKTAAFALPVLNALSEDPFGIFAVIMTPTRCAAALRFSSPSTTVAGIADARADVCRELAFQIGEQFAALGAPIGVRCEVVVGGVGKDNGFPIFASAALTRSNNVHRHDEAGQCLGQTAAYPGLYPRTTGRSPAQLGRRRLVPHQILGANASRPALAQCPAIARPRTIKH